MKIILAILVFSLLAAGCTQQAERPVVTIPSPELTTSTPVQEKPVVVTAERTESTMILITYKGSPDADQLIELETTIISSRGSVKTQSMGSRLDTTPVKIGGTEIFQGPFTEKAHVIITAFFTNGTHRKFLDTWI
jgi:hypothetical protein